jgi:hypothetical protein
METLIQVAGFVAAAVAISATSIALGASESSDAGIVSDLLSLIVLLAAGWAIALTPTDQYARMRSVFWFFAVSSFSSLAGTFVGDTLNMDGKAAVFTTGLLVAVFAAALWWISKRSLQAVALLLALYLTVIALVVPDTSSLNPLGFTTGSFGGSFDLTGVGLAAWLLGLAIIAVSLLGLFEPKRTGITMGCIGAVFGPIFIDFDFFKLITSTQFPWVGITIGLVTGIGLLLVGEHRGERISSGFGIGASFFYAGTLVSDEVNGKGPGVVVMLVGLAVLAAAVLWAKGAIAGPPIPPAPASPPAGDESGTPT